MYISSWNQVNQERNALCRPAHIQPVEKTVSKHTYPVILVIGFLFPGLLLINSHFLPHASYDAFHLPVRIAMARSLAQSGLTRPLYAIVTYDACAMTLIVI